MCAVYMLFPDAALRPTDSIMYFILKKTYYRSKILKPQKTINPVTVQCFAIRCDHLIYLIFILQFPKTRLSASHKTYILSDVEKKYVKDES